MTRKESLIFWASFGVVGLLSSMLGGAVLAGGPVSWWIPLLPVGAWALCWLAYSVLMLLVWWVVADLLD